MRFGSIVAHPDGIVDLDAVEGVDADLIVRPFSRKGVFTSLRQFTINAMNIHHGMEAIERFGVRWTGSHDFAESGVPDAVTAGDISALVAFQATLPPPTVKTDLPEDWRHRGGARAPSKFNALGCASCHIADAAAEIADLHRSGALTTWRERCARAKSSRRSRSTLSKLPFAANCKKNEKGEWLIPLFSDLKRHLDGRCEVNALGNELQAQRFVERDVFLTPRLWGVGSTAPYGHRGDFRMLDEIIAAHGGEARFARDAYLALDTASGTNVIAFLRSLVIKARNDADRLLRIRALLARRFRPPAPPTPAKAARRRPRHA